MELNTKDKQINDILNENEKIIESCFYKTSNLLCISILSKEEVDIMRKNEIQKQIANIVNDGEIQIQCIFSIDKIDEKILKSSIYNLLIEDNPLYKNYNKDSIKIEFANDKLVINLYLPMDIYDYLNKSKFSKKFNQYMEKNSFKEYELLIRMGENKMQDLDVLDVRDDFLYNNPFEDKRVSNEYEVRGLDIIHGKRLTKIARTIESVKDKMEEIQLAGKICFFQKNTYNKKTQNDAGEEIVEEKIRYNFELEDRTGKIKAVIFPTKELLKKGDIFSNGQEVICLCDVDNYNNHLSIKVKEIGFCCLPKVEEKIVEIKAENDRYVFVQPEKYVEANQINFLEEKKKCDVPMLANNTYVVFDLETTGLEARACKIIEIGAVKVQNGEIIETFSCLINPETYISKEITDITGITNEMVSNQPTFAQVCPDFYKFTRNSIMVAHNANFDMGFMTLHGKNEGYIYDNEYLDTLAIARSTIKGLKNYKLKTICDYLKVDLINAHRAINDTLATAKCFIKLAKLM